ncbi:protein phosphatase 2C domain-containing protein [Streptomyces apricus]|uniref:Protein phosphatase 2C domain-containing protein n=1 Tax=Streptomyces apricus TaxID=1828112 RepID=A0A5B0BHI5_9ACTN|nr:protein phosphatase 2C domain-containing protein [Streptomyces apricus]
MSQQGERPTGHQDDWWGQLYDDSTGDTGPTPDPDSLDDRFTSATNTLDTPQENPGVPRQGRGEQEAPPEPRQGRGELRGQPPRPARDEQPGGTPETAVPDQPAVPRQGRGELREQPPRFRASVARPGDTLLLCSNGLAEPLRGEPRLVEHLTARWSPALSGSPDGPPGLAAFLADTTVRVKGYADDRTAAAVWEA